MPINFRLYNLCSVSIETNMCMKKHNVSLSKLVTLLRILLSAL